MAFVPAHELIQRAYREGYAVGAFNVNNMEIVQAIVEAAEAERSPAILQASQGAIRYAGIEYITALARTAAESVNVPLALHLDHGTDFEQVMRCIRSGFTSVMYDGSHHPLEQNIAETARIVEIAHAVGVSVEGEIGRLVGIEDDVAVSELEAALTDPEHAARFARETGIDFMAVAFGTRHGFYKGEPRLDFERLRRIRELVEIPIVMHGGSGVPDHQVRRAIELGVSKINIDTELRHAFVTAARRVLERHPDEIDPRKILGPGRDAMREKVREKMRLFGSSGKA
ncbi:MAG TPA: class II fructose-1,6-bisphosphate aldolase [Bacillota bacterium]